MTTVYLNLDGYQDELNAIAESTNGTVQVLDVGCGSGAYHHDLEQYLERELGGRRAEPVDIDIVGMDQDRESLKEVENGILYDVSRGFPFSEDSFDIVISNKMMPNIDRAGREKVVSESRRVLKESGFMAHHSYQLPD